MPEIRTTIVGSKYQDGAVRRLAHMTTVGLPIILTREPTNEHDPNAVACHTADGQRLGYVPRQTNEPIARALDAGQKVTAKLCAEAVIYKDELKFAPKIAIQIEEKDNA
jgi:hypothetical protein